MLCSICMHIHFTSSLVRDTRSKNRLCLTAVASQNNLWWPDTESQNQSCWGWRGPLEVILPNNLLKQGHQETVAQENVQAALNIPKNTAAALPLFFLWKAPRKSLLSKVCKSGTPYALGSRWGSLSLSIRCLCRVRHWSPLPWWWCKW